MVDAVSATANGWPLAIVAGASAVALAVVLVGALLARRSARRKAEARLQADLRAGRFTRAVDYLTKKGRLVEAAEIEEKRGEPDRAVKLLEQAGEVALAASVYERGGEWQMSALTLKDGGLLREAAKVYARADRPAAAAELLEELGDLDAAKVHWQRIGRLDKVADIETTQGAGRKARKLRAQFAEAQGDWDRAAELWEELDKPQKAIAAWTQAGRPLAAGRLLVQAGDIAAGAALLIEGEAYLEAAPLLSRLGKYREAAEAAYRGGDPSSCIANLQLVGDYLEIARVYSRYGLLEEAKQTLAAAPATSEHYRACMESLAARELQDRRHLAALDCYRKLIVHSIERHAVGRHTRRWIAAAAELYIKGGYVDEALEQLELAQRLGVMTPELQGRLDALRPALEETRSNPNAPASQMRARASALGVPTHERYDIRAKLGQGGNGIIYHAWDRRLDRGLVVKMIANEALPTEMSRRWFLREAHTAAKLNHPNIVTIYDIGEIEDQPFIAMEYVDGDNLRQRLGEELPLTAERLAPIFRQLASAVSYAHSEGVIHRDIKMDNVMIKPDGVVKLMDFGLAIALNGPDQSLVMAGTPLYMSPEQIRGGQIDQQSDVYALGVLLYKILTGRYPFESGNILEHHRETPPADPREHNQKLSDRLAKTILRSLAKSKGARYQSVADLAAAMEKALA